LHELAITEAIVSQVCAHVGGGRVGRVVVEIGQLTAVLPDAVRFSFDVVTSGTIAEGAELEIIEVPGRGHCVQCGESVAYADTLIATCTACGGIEIAIETGQELRIRSVSVEVSQR
jgi:hydrogenase nickel incorporation protein HypA/HybF